MSFEKQLRVLYSFPHRLGAPGIGTTAWQQASNLVQHGVEVHVASASLERPVHGAASSTQSLAIGRFRVPHRALGSIDRAMAWHDVVVAQRLKSMKPRVDLVHGWPSGSLATIKVAHELGIPFALERPSAHTRFAYDMNHQISAQLGLDVPSSSYAASNPRRLKREQAEFDSADKLLCPSDFVVKTFTNEGYGDTLVRHHYGFDPHKFKPLEPADRKADDPLRVAYVGKCFPLKGLHVALDAWFRSEVSEVGSFTICGDFEHDYRELLKSELAHPSVNVMGFTDDVEGVLQRCDALLLPSAAEGSALVGYEGRAAGCVLLASTSSGVPAVHETDSLLHEFGDAAHLAQQITALHNDRSYLDRLREASIAGIQKLTWSDSAGRLIEIYNELIS